MFNDYQIIIETTNSIFLAGGVLVILFLFSAIAHLQRKNYALGDMLILTLFSLTLLLYFRVIPITEYYFRLIKVLTGLSGSLLLIFYGLGILPIRRKSV
jgi:hypothetical protein